jgi:hypothetical protein
VSWTSHIAGVLDEIRNLTQSGNVFTWKTAEIPCTASFARRGSLPTEGGFDLEAALTLTVQLAEFISSDTDVITADSEIFLSDNDLPTPAIGKTITYKGKRYRIYRTELAPSGTFANLLCEDINR